MTVWRIKLNSMRGEEEGGRPDWDEAKAHCRAAGVVGVGWGLSKLRHGARLQTVLAAWRAFPNGKSGADTIARLANQVEDGDLMWTRDKVGQYWLCQITGPWRYDKTLDSVRYDLYNIRPCRWLQKPFRDYEVPGAVVTGFIGFGQTLRRIGDHPAATKVTGLLWAHEGDPTIVIPPMSAEEAMADLLDPIDVEDVVLYLQAQGWLLIPSTRMHDTPVYEAALRHKDTGQLTVVSVKSGAGNPVPVPELAKAAGGAKPYAYSTHNSYSAPPGKHGVIEIRRDEVVAFMDAHPELLPPRIARWLVTARGYKQWSIRQRIRCPAPVDPSPQCVRGRAEAARRDGAGKVPLLSAAPSCECRGSA